MVHNHAAILAGDRDDKSQITRVLVEELLLPQNRAAVLLFDIDGRYETLTDLQANAASKTEDGYAPKVKVVASRDVRIRISSLDYYDILSLLPEMSDRQESILSKAYDLLRKHKKGDYRWDIQDLIRAVYEVDSQESEDGEIKIGASASALEWKLDKLARSPFFHAFDHLASTDLFEPGQATILQINGMSQEEQQMICATLLLQSINAYQNTQENLIQPGDENYLPYPIFILLEEAHRFVNHEPSRSKAVIRALISERWMFGVGLGLISQYPSRLDADILHHCGSQFMMKMVSPVEQDRLNFSFKAVEENNALQEIQTFAKSGQLFVSGSCINNSTFCQIRQSYTKVGSNRFNAIDQWLHHSQNRSGE